MMEGRARDAHRCPCAAHAPMPGVPVGAAGARAERAARELGKRRGETHGAARPPTTVYQRGLVIDSQPVGGLVGVERSISKGIGD